MNAGISIGDIAGPLLLAAGGMAWAVRHPSSSVLAPSFWRGPSSQKRIALTFDDGPSESTGDILRVLEEFQARGTFFQVGQNARRLPDLARACAALHEVGNHTETHARLWTLGPSGVQREVREAQESIEWATGARPRWFRAPYGVRWFGLREAQEENGLTGAMWSTIGHDWNEPAGHVAARLDSGLWAGAIFCLHDGRELAERPDISATVEATRWFLGHARDRGFEFVTLTELLCPPTSLTESAN